MQQSTSDSEYENGLKALTYAPPTVYADWGQDGYGAVGSIDDLTRLVGRPIEVNHFLDDSLPDAVSFVSGVGTSELVVPLVSGPSGESGVQYFSPMQTTSALAAYDRDVAPVKIETRLVTPSGPSAVRIFTGRMTSTPLKGRRAELQAMSAARLKLSNVVQPPVRVRAERGLRYGLTAAWPVVYAMHACGIYPSPPPPTGTRLWVPLHGSGNPFLPNENAMETNPAGTFWGTTWVNGAIHAENDKDPQLTRGPFVGAVSTVNTSTYQRYMLAIINNDEGLEAGSDWFSQTANQGRVQFYVRGDAIDVGNTPGGSNAMVLGTASPISYVMAGAAFCNGNGTGIFAGVDINRHVYVEIRESASRRYTAKSAPTVLTDTFARNTANGFGVADTGQSYTINGTAADYSTTTGTGGLGQIDTNTTASNYYAAAAVGTVDQEVTSTLRISALPASGTLSVGVVARWTDASNYYRAEMQVATTGAITLRVIRRAAGVETVLISGTTGLTYIASTDYFLRFQVIGSTLRVKLRDASLAEFSTWGQEVYNETGLTTGSGAGTFCRNDSAATTHIFSWNDLTVYNLASGQIPVDSAFHFVGCAWDIANNKVWIKLDSTLTTFTPSPALSTAGLPTAHEFFESDTILAQTFLPMAEFMFTTGAQASVSTQPLWINDATWFTQTATVSQSALELEAVALESPQEAWALIGNYAQSEFAALRTDENDNVLYLTQPYWARTEQQTVLDELTAGRDSEPPNVFFDPSKIRNTVRVEFNQLYVDDVVSPVVAVNSILLVPPGGITYIFATSFPATRLTGGRLYILSATQIDGSDVSPPNFSYVALNTEVDGTGSQAEQGAALTGTTVYGEVISWTAGQVVVQFTNTTAIPYYIVHAGIATLNYLQIGAYAIQEAQGSETVYEIASIVERGFRGLSINLPAVQRSDMAQRMAGVLAGDLANPVADITGLELIADARRQPGDLVTYTDVYNSGASGRWRFRGVKHVIDGGGYRQVVTMRQARSTGVWDTSMWDSVIWGE